MCADKQLRANSGLIKNTLGMFTTQKYRIEIKENTAREETLTTCWLCETKGLFKTLKHRGVKGLLCISPVKKPTRFQSFWSRYITNKHPVLSLTHTNTFNRVKQTEHTMSPPDPLIIFSAEYPEEWQVFRLFVGWRGADKTGYITSWEHD